MNMARAIGKADTPCASAYAPAAHTASRRPQDAVKNDSDYAKAIEIVNNSKLLLDKTSYFAEAK